MHQLSSSAQANRDRWFIYLEFTNNIYTLIWCQKILRLENVLRIYKKDDETINESHLKQKRKQ